MNIAIARLLGSPINKIYLYILLDHCKVVECKSLGDNRYIIKLVTFNSSIIGQSSVLLEPEDKEINDAGL